jgi:hypothetical protein
MQAFEQSRPLDAGEMGQHVHAENAVEAANVDRLGQIHGVEGDQAAQARLDQQVRSIRRSLLRRRGTVRERAQLAAPGPAVCLPASGNLVVGQPVIASSVVGSSVAGFRLGSAVQRAIVACVGGSVGGSDF